MNRHHQPLTEERLIVFTRYPQPHHSKTRLIPALGPDGAAALQTDMTRHTLEWARRLALRRKVLVEVLFAGGDEEQMRRKFGRDWRYAPQGEGDLGERMSRAFRQAFSGQGAAQGAERTVIVGADCPEITCELAAQAFVHLLDNELVLGPAADGGYYLIGLTREGMSQVEKALFEDIAWGGAQVFSATLQRARARGLRCALLPQLSDVDRPEDLPVWRRAKSIAGQQQAAKTSQRVSVIIPTLNDDKLLEETLAGMEPSGNVEVVVVDGAKRLNPTASPDLSSKGFEVRRLNAKPGRAAQMNFGAGESTGELLLFLHADTKLPPCFDEVVRRILSSEDVSAGAFRLRIERPTISERIIVAGANLRARWLGMPYGDQALFLKRRLFEEIGGFTEMPIMEDFQLVRRLRRYGRIVLAPEAAATSPRRWRRLGPWRSWWINQTIVMGYYLGISPDRLARWYRRESSSPLAPFGWPRRQ